MGNGGTLCLPALRVLSEPTAPIRTIMGRLNLDNDPRVGVMAASRRPPQTPGGSLERISARRSNFLPSARKVPSPMACTMRCSLRISSR